MTAAVYPTIEDRQALEGLLANVRRNRHGSTAYCPAHDDQHNSLSISEGEDGRLLVYCHAGCTFEQILAAAQMPRRPTQPRPNILPLRRKAGIVAEYDYVDEDGGLLYQVLRLDGKAGFPVRRPDGRGGWIGNVDGVRRVPYRLPELLEAAALEQPVVFCEGEKDADNVRALGIVATTSPFGAGKWQDIYATYFVGASRVIVLPDNDSPGEAHAETVAKSLLSVVPDVRILNLPNLLDKGDVSDWLSAGGTVEEFYRLSDTAPQYGTSSPIRSRYTLYDDAEIAQLPAPAWTIGDTLPKNALAVLVGLPAHLKTFIALDWAAHVQLGMDWHGRPVRRGQVVYVYAEGRTGIGPRIEAWKHYHGTGALGVLFLPQRIAINEPVDCAGLVEAVQARLGSPHIELLVLDTLNRCSTGNENSTEDMSAFVRGCDILRETTGGTVLVVHHKGHGDTDRGRGSSVLPAACDTEILCTRDADRITLECRKQKDAAEFSTIAMEVVPAPPSLVLKPSGVEAGGLRGQRLECLRVLHDNYTIAGASYKAWLDASGLSASSFNKARDWLRLNQFVKSCDGKWQITDGGRVSLTAVNSTSSTVTPPSKSGVGSTQLHHAGGVYNTPAVELDLPMGNG